MDFEIVGEDKLKIRLTCTDMLEAGVIYENMDYQDRRTRRMLMSLLEKAKKRTGFSPQGAKLFIETYETEDKGCNLYFTIIRRPVKLAGSQSAISPVLFEFRDAAELIAGACKVFERYSHRIYKSSLYVFNGKYRLLVYNLDYADNLSVYFLSEYAANLGCDEVLAAHTMEHGREIIADCALDILSKHFG